MKKRQHPKVGLRPDEAGQLPRKDAKPGPRKAYRRPDFVCEQVFETMALACGKINETQLQCHLNRRTS
jgi:hypothetical protein